MLDSLNLLNWSTDSNNDFQMREFINRCKESTISFVFVVNVEYCY